jgi:magnesium-dependent phosphatase 1
MLQLVVFDLDFCVWKPEMYQIRGPPTLANLKSIQPKQPRKRRKNQQDQASLSLPKRPTTNRKGMIVTDSAGTPITVFDGASHALSEINRWRKQTYCPVKNNVKVAVASCTDEPGYARKCMDWLIVDDGSTLSSCFDHIEIRPGDKRRHFESLQRITGIPYEEMCFFDDYDLNINNVSSLGVKCFHTPRGMTKDSWDDALNTFGLN